MRPRISIRGFVHPSVRPSVRPSVGWSVTRFQKTAKMTFLSTDNAPEWNLRLIMIGATIIITIIITVITVIIINQHQRAKITFFPSAGPANGKMLSLCGFVGCSICPLVLLMAKCHLSVITVITVIITNQQKPSYRDDEDASLSARACLFCYFLYKSRILREAYLITKLTFSVKIWFLHHINPQIAPT